MTEKQTMKTYTMELDGKPILAFRARDDDEAATFPDLIYSPASRFNFKKPEGTITVRPATIPERAEWTAYSVWDYEDHETGNDEASPNCLLVSLLEDDEEEMRDEQ